MGCWTLTELSDALNMKIETSSITEANSVQFNSKEISKGDLFIALHGGKGDGHDYVHDAFDRGASFAIVSKEIPSRDSIDYENRIIKVSSTDEALTKLAKYKREASNALFIGITGSCGKTTTKDILKFVLSKFGPTFGTPGNQNNYLGIRLTLASMPKDVQFSIVEMGMNAYGELKQLTNLVQPDISVITTIGEAHLGQFNSLDEIADAKCEIFEGLNAEKGIAIIPADAEQYPRILQCLQKLKVQKIFTFGKSEDAHVKMTSYSSEVDDSDPTIGKATMTYKVFGEEIVHVTETIIPECVSKNFCVAILILHILKLKIHLGLKKLALYKLLDDRGKMVRAGINNSSFHVICDYYNGNPSSMKAALKHFRNFRLKRKYIILGDLLELGERSVDLHKSLIPHILESGACKIILIGTISKCLIDAFPITIQVEHFYNLEEFLPNIVQSLKNCDLLLIKGSNGMKLKNIMESFEIME